jgi:hypothetical protein
LTPGCLIATLTWRISRRRQLACMSVPGQQK